MAKRQEQLDDRGMRILRELISHYCLTGEPVGSRTLSRKTRMRLSPATIRNVLSDLEEMGYIMQPHTSAGRIPTDKGYRFYVNHLLKNCPLNDRQKEMIEDSIHHSAGNFSDLLLLTTELLSRLSHNVAMAVVPDLNKMKLENIEFVKISSKKILAIIVTKGGVVANKVIEIEEPLLQDELTHIGNYLKTEFIGQTLPEIRRRLLDLKRQEQIHYDLLLQKAVLLSQKTLEDQPDREQIFIIGASQIVSYPEFAGTGTPRDVLEALEHKSRMIQILTGCIDGEGIHILIGSENKDPDLQEMSLISSAYQYQNQPIGTLGILGPKRMEYARMIPLVGHIARVVSDILNRDN
jgi:heat-inducible transcriptional repressor